MTSRERVLTTLNHQEPDRVPRDLMGNATMILDDCYIRLRDHLGLSPIKPIREGSTANFYDERILKHFDIDFRRVFLVPNKPYNQLISGTGNTFRDVWSITYKKDGLWVTAVSSPLKNVSSSDEVDSFPWPDGSRLFETGGLREKVRTLQKSGYAVVARNPYSPGFIDRACQLMGTEDFLVALLTMPDIARSVLNHIYDIYSSIYYHFLKEVGPYVDIVETADDIGTQNSLLISPELYREFIKPFEKKFYSNIHELAPKSALFRHTDGAIFPLIKDFIEIGVDILNPVQTSTEGMDAGKLKKTYGKDITFHGAIEKLDDSPQIIEQEVKEKLAILKPGGGYIFAPCNHIIDASPETILAMYNSCQKYGQY